MGEFRVIVLLAVCAAAVGGFVGYQLSDRPSQPEIKLNQPLPDFALPAIDGSSFSSRQIERGPVLINFWAPWCAPCRKEMPELDELHDQLAEEGVAIIGIALDRTEAVRAFLEEFPVEYPILLGENGGYPLSSMLGNAEGVLPYTVLFDSQLELEEVFRGRVDIGTLRHALVSAIR